MAATSVVLTGDFQYYVKGELHTDVSHCHLEVFFGSIRLVKAHVVQKLLIVELCVFVIVWCGWSLLTVIVSVGHTPYPLLL